MTNIIMLNSVHAITDSPFYKGEDGKFHWGPADQETLTGLKLMQKAYKDGRDNLSSTLGKQMKVKTILK